MTKDFDGDEVGVEIERVPTDSDDEGVVGENETRRRSLESWMMFLKYGLTHRKVGVKMK